MCLVALFGIEPAWAAPQQSLESFQRVVKDRTAKDQAARISLLKHAHELGEIDLSSEKKLSRHNLKHQRLLTRASDVDASNVKWLKKHVDKFGLPAPSVIGADTAERFFILVLHADRDREFQKRCLELMEASPTEWNRYYVQLLQSRSSGAPLMRLKFPEKTKRKEPVATDNADWETLRSYLPNKEHLSFVIRVFGFGGD